MAYSTQADQEGLAASIKQAREEATMTASQLTATLSALNTLVGQTKGDLNPAFQAFRAEIPKTQNAAAATHARLETMSREKAQYFAEWQKAIDGINNNSLQKKAQKRLKTASEHYAEVEADLAKAGEKFRPFLSDLADVEKALSMDVTARGIKNIKSVVRSANWNYNSVAGSINSALKEMDKLEKDLSSQAS